MAMIKLDPLACEAIKKTLLDKGLPLCARIEIRSTGCCDASLGLAAEAPEAYDLTAEIDGLTIAIDPQTRKMVGDVSISSADIPGGEGFVLVSERPLNEWAGFGASTLRVCAKS